MALVIADRVKEVTSTTGTGTLSLSGASTGYQSFSDGVGDGNTCYSAINTPNGSEWEVGIGTYTASGSTLSRDTILDSSNSGSAVNLSAGTKDVFVTEPASKMVLGGQGYTMQKNTITVSSVIDDGYNAYTVGSVTLDDGVTVTVPTGASWYIGTLS